MPANRSATGKFISGVSGNPSGRPKVDPEVREILKAACPDAARELVKYIHNKNPKIAIWAITEILNRVYGKPEVMSKVELSGAIDGGPIVFKWQDDSNNPEKAPTRKPLEDDFTNRDE